MGSRTLRRDSLEVQVMIAEKLNRIGYDPVEAMVNRSRKADAWNDKCIDAGSYDANAAKIALDTDKALLNKTAPDLKAVDIQADVKSDTTGQVNLVIGNAEALFAFTGGEVEEDPDRAEAGNK